jgi:hypothetical protein
MEITNESELCFQVYFGKRNGKKKPSEKLTVVINMYGRRLCQNESKRLTQKAAVLAVTPTHKT